MALTGKQASRYASKPSRIPPSTPATWGSLLLHVVALLSLSNSFRLLFAPTPISELMETQKGGHWSFLTVLGLGASWLTFVAALLKDVFPGVKLFDYAKSALSIVTIPAEGIITILYWGLQAIDPNLLTPKESEFHIPLALDISLHFLPALFLWTDFLTYSPAMPREINPLLISAVTTFAYTSWMEYTSAYNGRFPYPFLNDLTPPYRAAFYVCMIPVLVSLFHLANGVHRLIRGKNSGVQSEAAKKAENKAEKKLQ